MRDWQKVIFLNYGTVKTENIARVLKTDAQTVILEAKAMGLDQIVYDPNWQTKGYVTVIRNNWSLLNMEDICVLLEITVEQLKAQLTEFDFLSVKLGEKPNTEKILHTLLTPAQQKETEKICHFVKENFREPSVVPFDFYSQLPRYPVISTENDIPRFHANYCARYGDTLLDSDLPDYSHEVLERLRAVGTNGVWIHETLRNLAPFPLAPEFSGDYTLRVKNLDTLIRRCHEHGIDVYLYLNEPRSLPASFFEKYPEFRGQKTDEGEYCLCTSLPVVQQYLYDAVKYLAEKVPLLKGIMTITMSENPTHCHSRNWNSAEACPHCRNRAPEQLAAEVNNIMAKALRDGNGHTRLIANLWSWSAFMGWTEQQTLEGIRLLDPEIDVLCVSEYSKDFVRGGVPVQVVDYSISVTGPSELTKKSLSYAQKLGHRIWAKVQINNSWECSAVPYLPVFDLMTQHIKNLKQLGVEGFMLGWSLGGYPGGALSLCNLTCSQDEADENGWYQAVYEADAVVVQSAVRTFSKAFEEFPFSVDSLYYGGQTLGPGNDILDTSARESTMVCYTFADYEKYTAPYGLEIYLSQYEKLLHEWQKGLTLLQTVHGNLAVSSLKNVALGAYIHFASAYQIALSAKYRRSNDGQGLQTCIKEMLSLTKQLYGLISRDATIGFEMTNHYFYNANLLLFRMLELSKTAENKEN